MRITTLLKLPVVCVAFTIGATNAQAGQSADAGNGRMAVGIMGIGFGGTAVGMRIDVVDLADDGMSVKDVSSMSLPMPAGRFRSVVQGPDGSLYTAVDGGTIYKLTPK